MPENSLDWTTAEIVRTIVNVGRALERIETKIDDRPTKSDQARKDKEQDDAILIVEQRLNSLLLLGVGSALTGASGLIMALVNR